MSIDARYTEKKYFMTFSQKTSFSRKLKHGFKKTAKLAFIKSVYAMILVKKVKVFYLLTLSNIDGEKVFAGLLDRKDALEDY